MVGLSWNYEHIALASIAFYSTMIVLALAISLIMTQIRHSRSTETLNGRERYPEGALGYPSTAVRLLTCWLFAMSTAFLVFARLQCGSYIGLEPFMCSIGLQVFIAGEMHCLIAEQVHHRCCLLGTVKKQKLVIIKFFLFVAAFPIIMIGSLYFLLGPRGFQETNGDMFSISLTGSFIPHYYQNKSISNISEFETDNPNLCWFSWNSTSVRLTSSLLAVTLLFTVTTTWLNIVTLSKLEKKRVIVPYLCWWGVAVRPLLAVITISKWISVSMFEDCPSNIYNIYASLIITPLLLSVMFFQGTLPRTSSYINLTKLKELPGTSTSHLSEPAELRTYTYVNFTEDDMMLRQDVIADDVTTPVTNYKRGYVDFAETMNHNEDHTGEGRFSRDYKKIQDKQPNYAFRRSVDEDDGVNSYDGEGEATRCRIDGKGTSTSRHISYDQNENKANTKRLSHAESTDSGMGFSDNAKDAENVRFSDSDNYGTIRHIQVTPPEDAPENRKSLIDGDTEYDEVMDFMTSPMDLDIETGNPQISSFLHPKPPTPEKPVSKYAELDLAKILHTRRRHKNILTEARPIEEEKPELGLFDSLKRKRKPKNSFGNYATYGRNWPKPRQYPNDNWGLSSRPSSTCDGDDNRISRTSNSLDHRHNYSFLDASPANSDSSNINSRYNNDLMMTTEIEGLSVTPTEKRWSWKSSVKSSTPTELKSPSDSERSKRWSYASNSSHAYEKPPTNNSRGAWNALRRFLGVGSSSDKSHDNKSTRAASSSSFSSKSRNNSLFRGFSVKRHSKHKVLNKRRNSVPTKSEWDVARQDDTFTELDMGKPTETLEQERKTKNRNKIGNRLMSFRTLKKQKSMKSPRSMSKSLSISSPQLAVNAVNPTRNYSEHQLLTLNPTYNT